MALNTAEYSYHGTTTPGEWDEVKLTGVLELASSSPIELCNHSETEILWYSWTYPDSEGTPPDPNTLEPRGDGTYVVFPRSKMVLAPDHRVDQFIVTSENQPADYSIQVIW